MSSGEYHSRGTEGCAGLRILFLSQYFPPESNAPAIRVSEMTCRWASDGHDVTVLTAFPHHPAGVVPASYRGHLVMRESAQGVRVERTFIWAAANKGRIRRILSYLSWMASAMLLGIWRTPRTDVVIATSPQFLCAVAGLWLARWKRAPFVLEIRDLWPDSILAVEALRDGPVVGLLRRVEGFLYRSADAIVIVSPGFRRHIESFGVAPSRISVVPNGIDPEVFAPGPCSDSIYREHGVQAETRILYCGTVGMAHGLEIILDAAERLREEPGVAFVVAGDGARREELSAEARRRNLKSVHFVGMQPRVRIGDWLRGASAVLVHLRRTPLFETVLPSKLFECMGCGRPVLLGVAGLAAEVVTEADCGWVLTPGDAAALVERIRQLRIDPGEAERRGRRGRAFVEVHYDRARLAREYLDRVLIPITERE